MLTKEKRETSVVATSPFLSLEQAAGELRTTVVHLMRLIARGFLVAVQAGDTWRVRPADLDVYAKMGSADFDAPKFDNDGVWFDDHETDGFAGRFASNVRNVIADNFLPELPRDAKGKPITTMVLPIAGALASVVIAPALTHVVRIATNLPAPAPRFNRAAEQYAASEIRKSLSFHLRSGHPESAGILSGKTDLMKLYASPGEYQRLTKLAVDAFNFNSISLGKEYPSGDPGRTIRVNYKVPHTSLGVDLTKVLRAAL